jgi:hypothetical protein
MPNDDLGTFPMPTQPSDAPADPGLTPTTVSAIPSEPVSIQPSTPSTDQAPLIDATPSPIQEPAPQSVVPPQNPEPAFEPTPDEIPSFQQPSVTPTEATETNVYSTTAPSLGTEQEKLIAANESLIEMQAPPETQPAPIAATPPEPAKPEAPLPATAPKTRSIAPIIIVVLLIVASIGIVAAVYMTSQTNKLKSQLSDITQTLEKQQNTLTPTPTPTVFEITTPTATPTSTPSAVVATPSAKPTVSVVTNLLKPLANASSALRVAINHSPNAQLILIKVDNANDTATAVTKYFFRQDLTTKTYFYVAITGTGEPQIIDKQIYVTPDDNIPSLNDAILANKMGLELDAALKLTYTLCANQVTCASSPVKAQYIQTGTGIIWQISVYTQGLTGTPLIAQINAATQAILYKSDGFAALK